MSSKERKSPLELPQRTTTLSQGIFSLAKSAVGAGTLALHSQFAKLGLFSGLAVLAFASLSTTSTLHFLSRVSANTDLGSYFAIGRMAYGTAGEVASMIALILFIISALIFYLVLAAGYVIDFLKFVHPGVAGAWFSDYTYMTIMIALVTLPMACLRDMSALGKASIMGMVCMCYILVLTVVDYFVDSAGRAATESPLIIASSIDTFFQCFSTMLFAFVNHFTMVSLVPVLIDPTPSRRAKVTIYSATFIFVFYAILATFGYLHFGVNTATNLLNSSTSATAWASWTYNLGRLMMAIVLILSYPLLLDPCRGTIEGALGKFLGGRPAWKSTAGIRSIAITVALIVISALVGIFFQSQADTILKASTAFSGSLMVFIFPSAFFLKLSDRYLVHGWERGTAYFNIVFGFLFMILGTFFSVKSMIQEAS